MRLFLVAFLISSAGCLDGGVVTDASAAVDMAEPRDLEGVDLQGLLNCLQLNACTRACKNQMCVAACRDRGTPSAVAKEYILQQCFNMYCPQVAPPAAPICEPDTNMMYTAACLTCITNTQKAATTECSSPTAPECTKCFNAATDCKND
jgi:hypothetical protein